MRTDTGQGFKLEDYRPSNFLIPKTKLSFRLDPDRTTVVSELTVERNAETSDGTPLVLDGDGLAALPDLVERGLLQQVGDRLVLTDGARLLADAVVRELS